MSRAFLIAVALFLPAVLRAQHAPAESDAGVDVRATVTAQFAASPALTDTPRSGAPVAAGFRAVVYPVFKLDDHWSVTAALQALSSPYFSDSDTVAGYGLKGYVLQASLNYNRVSDRGSLLLRAGQLSTAFGSFPLRYDDADNPLTDVPLQYGYYYEPVATLGLLAAQADATRGRFDGRFQFANASPSNPRSITAPDQYGNFAGGAGVTVHQGLRLGMSASRGPYLDRHSAFFFPGEANPSKLPAHALGFDASWSRSHWNLQGEWQNFVFPYQLIPVFRQQAGYAEARRVLSPRWSVATRAGYLASSAGPDVERVELTTVYRPNRLQLLKFGYQFDHTTQTARNTTGAFTIQFVTSLHVLSRTWK